MIVRHISRTILEALYDLKSVTSVLHGATSPAYDVLGEPDGETGGDAGVGGVGRIICIYPYVPLFSRGPPGG